MLATVLGLWFGAAEAFLVDSDNVIEESTGDISRYPYLVSLRHPDRDLEHFCAGALISNTAVLTAAHCVDPVNHGGHHKPVVHVNRSCTNCGDETAFIVAEVSRSIVHPFWTGKISDGADMAVLVLHRPHALRGWPTLRVTPQPELEERYSFEFLGFAGWGQQPGSRVPARLQAARVPYRLRGECEELYAQANYRSLASDIICAGGLRSHLCQGDSGGPLIVLGESPEDDFGIGILSAGQQVCGEEPDLPGLFVSLHHYAFELMLLVPALNPSPIVSSRNPSPLPSPPPPSPPPPSPPPPSPPPPSLPSAETDRQVLGQLRDSQSPVNAVLSQWSSYESACNWIGVRCDGANRVVELILMQAQIEGTLPARFSLLDKLQRLYISNNFLTGTLPAQFSKLTDLTILHTYNNDLSGTLPREWSSMARMQEMVLALNRLSGTLPPSWGSMTAVSSMLLQSNRLTGRLPVAWSSMGGGNIRQLDLSNNKLTFRTVPPKWAALGEPQFLGLEGNEEPR